MQQQPHESRGSMRQRVRSLAKFQMQRLVSRRESRQNKDRYALPHGQAHLHHETVEPPIDTTPESQPIIGLPGFRTQTGHTGLDPIESLTEVAYLLGKFIRLFITGQLRTHNPLYLAAMATAGLCLIVPFILCVLAAMSIGWNVQTIGLAVLLAPFAIVGVTLWASVSISLRSERVSSAQ